MTHAGPALDHAALDRFEPLMRRHPQLRTVSGAVDAAFRILSGAYRAGHRVLVCGNGGSAADAEHIVGELMKSMARPRPLSVEARRALMAGAPETMSGDARYLADHLEEALPAISLVSQTSLLLAVSNDQSPDVCFAQQVLGYGRAGDVLWALSTSGRSRNVVLAALTARAQGMPVIAMTGSDGDRLGALADAWIRVPAPGAGEAQELHEAVYHALCAALEAELLGSSVGEGPLELPPPPPPVEHPWPVRLAEHLYLVGGRGRSHPYDGSAYLVTGPAPVLIDCGTLFGWPAVRANVRTLGLDPADLRAVLATHCHFDHVSGFAQLSNESDARLLIHGADAPAAASGDRDRTSAFLYGAEFPPLKIGGALPERYESGTVLVRSIHTPGHTPGSACFVVTDGPTRVLVAGDTLFGGYHWRIRSDLDAWRDSLARLAAAGKEYDYVSTGHGARPLLPDAAGVLARARAELGVYFSPWFRPFYLGDAE